MHAGRYARGGWLRLDVDTTAWPTDASGDRSVPIVAILDRLGRHVTRDEEMTPDRSVTGRHRLRRQLGPEFAPGNYVAMIEWPEASDTVNRVVLQHFTVLPHGDSRGAYVGLSFYPAPNADYLLGQTDSGRLEARRRPR